MNGLADTLVFTSVVDGSEISGQVYVLEGLLHGRNTSAYWMDIKTCVDREEERRSSQQHYILVNTCSYMH
jgi:hypothetical protein